MTGRKWRFSGSPSYQFKQPSDIAGHCHQVQTEQTEMEQNPRRNYMSEPMMRNSYHSDGINGLSLISSIHR